MLGEDDELEESKWPWAFDCKACRYLCPTVVRTRPFGGADVNAFIVRAIYAVDVLL